MIVDSSVGLGISLSFQKIVSCHPKNKQLGQSLLQLFFPGSDCLGLQKALGSFPVFPSHWLKEPSLPCTEELTRLVCPCLLEMFL